MLPQRKIICTWSLVALALGALVALIVTDIAAGHGHHLDWALWLPVLFLEFLPPQAAGWRLPIEAPDFPPAPLLAAAPSRAPPA